MDEFIKLLDPAYELIQYRIKEDKVIFHIASTIAELECPFCGRKTSKVHSKLATTTSSGGLFLPLLRGIVTARPEGRYRKHFYWSAIKRYFLNLLFEILLLALLYTFELLHLLYYLLFRRNILLPKRLYPIYSAALDVYHKP